MTEPIDRDLGADRAGAATPTRPRRRGLKLRTLLVATAVAAVALALWRDFRLGVTFTPLAVAVGMAAIGLSQGGRRWRPRPWAVFLGLLATAVGLELVAAVLAYHTIGEMAMASVWLLTGWLNVLAVVTFAIGWRRVAVALLAFVALGIVPRQVFLAARWARVHAESAEIVEYLDREAARTGGYPTDLSGYRFRRPAVADLIKYRPETGDYTLYYSVATPTTSHWYSPGDGWSYYPD